MAIKDGAGYFRSVPFYNSTGDSHVAVIDKDEFVLDGETYRYSGPPASNTSHVCVKQGQPATD